MNQFFKSKTNIFGLGLALLGVAQYALPMIQLSPELTALATSVIGAAVIYLRSQTTMPVADKTSLNHWQLLKLSLRACLWQISPIQENSAVTHSTRKRCVISHWNRQKSPKITLFFSTFQANLTRFWPVFSVGPTYFHQVIRYGLVPLVGKCLPILSV